jgi:hypothetical protein
MGQAIGINIMRNLIDARARSEEFDAVVTYLNAVSQGLSFVERRDVADTLHELVMRRKALAKLSGGSSGVWAGRA